MSVVLLLGWFVMEEKREQEQFRVGVGVLNSGFYYICMNENVRNMASTKHNIQDLDNGIVCRQQLPTNELLLHHFKLHFHAVAGQSPGTSMNTARP